MLHVCTVYLERRTLLVAGNVAMRCLQRKHSVMFGGQMYTRMTCRLDAFLPVDLIKSASDFGAESHGDTA